MQGWSRSRKTPASESVVDLPLGGRLQRPQTFYHNLPSNSIPWDNCNSKLLASYTGAAFGSPVDMRMYSALFECHCEVDDRDAAMLAHRAAYMLGEPVQGSGFTKCKPAGG